MLLKILAFFLAQVLNSLQNRHKLLFLTLICLIIALIMLNSFGAHVDIM